MVNTARLVLLLFALTTAGLTWLFVTNRPLAEKVLTELAMPAGLLWIASLWLLIIAGFNRQRWAFVFSALIATGLFLAGNSYLANRFAVTLERPYLDSRPLEEPPLDVVVVLGGGATIGANGLSRLSWNGDRVMLAVRMYRRGLVERFVCSGARIEDLDRAGEDPQNITAELLIEVGVPADKIERIGGMNTSEEMRLLAELLQRQPVGRLGLITSAYHMPRALRLASEKGLQPIALPAQLITPPILKPSLLDLVPDEDSMMVTRIICKEHLARLVGR